MLLLTLFVFLFAGVMQAEANLSCVMTPESHSRMIFGKRSAESIRIWTCIIQNKGADPIVVSRATALRVMIDAGVIGFSEEAVRIYWKENVRLGMPKTIGRIFNQVVRVGGIIIGSGIIDVGKTLRFITVVGGESLPGIGAAFSARAPTLENFERLAGTGDIGVSGNSDAEFVMFSAKYDGPPKIEGVIDTGFSLLTKAVPMATFESIPEGLLDFPGPVFNPDPFPADSSLPPPSFAVPPGAIRVPGDLTGTPAPASRDNWEWNPNISSYSPSVVRVSWMGRQNVGVSDSDLEPVLELARVSGIASGVEMRLHGSEHDNDWASPDHLSAYGIL